MYRVISCITTEHDYRLVMVAALICAAAAVTSFKIYAHVRASKGLRRMALLLLTGVCSAAGIWATHFVAMLAYDPGLPTAYDPIITAISLLSAMFTATAGFALSDSDSRWRPVAGGALLGGGIGLMHYVGMQALIVPGTLHWDMTLVAGSLATGVAITSAAIVLFHRWAHRRAIWVCAGLLTLGICGLHFTGMAALAIWPDPTMSVHTSPIEGPVMAVVVAGVAMLIMLSGVSSAALIESQARHQRELDFQLQNMRFRAALDNMGEGLCMFDAEKRLVVCNDQYAQMYRLPPELLAPGTAHSDIIAHRVSHGILKGDRTSRAVAQKSLSLDQLPANMSSTRTDELADGRLVAVTRQPLVGGGWVATHKDVTEQRRSEAKIAHMALHDALTGLANRALLNERLEHALTRTRRGEVMAAHILDLDHFKYVNDTLGHAVGDKLLQEVGERLRALVRDIDTIARMGGDEFAILQVGLTHESDATRLAERVIQAISAPYEIDGHQVVTGTSVGIAVAPADGVVADQLVKNADLALYRAKGSGRSTFRFFEKGMDAELQQRRVLEQQLRKALAAGEFELHYQPCVDLASGKINGLEALIRWQHPERGTLAPATFIPLAEETGLIVPIGEWVINQACATAAQWPDTLKIAVNLSPAQLRSPGLLQIVVRALAASGLAPDRLELEITGQRSHPGHTAPAAPDRRSHRHGRFRYRLFLSQPPATLSLRQDQD